MKTTLLIVLIFTMLNTHSQDTVKVSKIDSIVTAINTLKVKPQLDTITQNYASAKMTIKTYMSAIIIDGTLIKYSNTISSETEENVKSKATTVLLVFYFNNNKLIKVEDSFNKGSESYSIGWYFEEGVYFFNNFNTEKGTERASFLLNIANTYLKAYSSLKN